MIVHSEHPLNAEPALDRLRAHFITPAADFYIRSHGGIPRLDEDSARLSVKGMVAETLDLSMQALRARFQQHTIGAVLQCAGNRRADLQAIKPVTGDPWDAGAIGNAKWTGVRLADVLCAAGIQAEARHVAFEAHDMVEIEGDHFKFGISIPVEKALSPDVLLAFAMNGAPLTAKHGFPLRLITPGFAGVRSPKWLASITAQAQPSANHLEQRDYKLLPPHMAKESADWQAAGPIEEMPLNAAICLPLSHARLSPGRCAVQGYAIATARAIARVDVSADGGRHWRQAELRHPDSPWSWTFWSAEFDLAPGEHELAVRAWDSAGQTQPAAAEDTWNFKGYLCAAWHRVPVRVMD